MNKLTPLLVATVMAFSAAGTYAATTQPQKRKACQAEATQKKLKGNERNRFIEQCLAKKPADEPTTPPPDKPAPAVPAPVPTPGTNPVEPNR